jgi:hypothetical protein
MIAEYDVLLRTLTPALHRPLHAGQIAIAATSRESFRTLADACWAVGRRSVWQQPSTPAQFFGSELLIIDGWENLPLATLEPQASSELRAPPALLLVDWPQPADVAQAHERSIARVLARPLLLADLYASLDGLLGISAPFAAQRPAA